MTLCVGLRHPISYLDQWDGNVFHDVFPTRTKVLEVSSQSSHAPLGSILKCSSMSGRRSS